MADVSLPNINKLVKEILTIIQTSTSKENLRQKLNSKKNDKNLVPAIIAIITGTVQVPEGAKQNVITAVPPEKLTDAIIAIITGAVQVPAGAKQNAITAVPPEKLADAIIAIILANMTNMNKLKSTLHANTRENIRSALNKNTTPNSQVVKVVLKVIEDSTKPDGLTKETARNALKVAGAPPTTADNITRLITEVLTKNETAAKTENIKAEVRAAKPATTNQGSSLIYRVISTLFKNKVPPSPKMTNGYNLSGNKNFIESKKKNANGNPTFNISIPGFTFKTNGVPPRTGYYRNIAPPQPRGPSLPPPPPPRNYSRLNLRALFVARIKYPNNRVSINTLIRSKLEDSIRELNRARGTTLFRRAAEILKLLPLNYPGRSNVVEIVLDEINRISRLSNLDSARRIFRNLRNRNVRDELNRRGRNLRERREEGGMRRGYRNEDEYRRRRGYGSEEEYRRRRNDLESRRRSLGSRRPSESNTEYAQRKAEYNRNKQEANRQELALRRAARMRAQPPQAPPPPPRLPNLGQRGNGGFPPAPGPSAGLDANEGQAPVPPLPPNQRQALANAGGVNSAVRSIAAVPGGAPEVAKAAEALNETGGNVAQAIQVKGVSPQAVQAVRNLGGVKNTVNVLEGLNTLSQTPATRRRKAAARKTARRPKKVPIRLTELNRVISAVKKQKLLSLVAHNVTRTNNIHPNDEKLKKYYKKVMKSYLLKKPFAKIAKKAAKKNN